MIHAGFVMNREWRQKVADSASEALAAAAKQTAEERAGWDAARSQLEERWTHSLKDIETKAAAQSASLEAQLAQVASYSIISFFHTMSL